MLVSVVWRLDQEWDQASFHLADHVGDGVAIGPTCIDAALALEVNLVRSAIDVLLSEALQIELTVFLRPLHYLPEDAVLSFMVNVTLVLELHRLAPIYIAIGHFTVWNILEGFVNDAIDRNSQ